MIVKHGNDDQREKRGGSDAEEERDCESLKDGVQDDDKGTDHQGRGREYYGSGADGAGLDDGIQQRNARTFLQLDKVHEQDRVPDDDAEKIRFASCAISAFSFLIVTRNDPRSKPIPPPHGCPPLLVG